MQQIISSAVMRMTSREIAELVGSRHDKVKQSIERLATDKENKPAVICLPPLGEYLDSLGRPASEYAKPPRRAVLFYSGTSSDVGPNDSSRPNKSQRLASTFLGSRAPWCIKRPAGRPI